MNPAATATSPTADAQEPSRVQLRLFAGFELTVGDAAIDLQPAARRLLAFAALARGRIGRAFTAYQLWPDKSEDRAKANLRSAIWRLQKVPVPLIGSTRSELWLQDTVWVDARQGLAAMTEACLEELIDNTVPYGVLECELLPDWYDDWLVTERERLRQLRLATLEQQAERLLASGRTREAIHAALTAVAVEPLRETAHRVVIRAHAAEGNIVEAHRQYRRFEDLLQRELGVAPSADIRALAHA